MATLSDRTWSSLRAEALNTRTQQLAETLGSHTVGIAAAIGDRTSELARTIDAQGATARDRMNAARSHGSAADS